MIPSEINELFISSKLLVDFSAKNLFIKNLNNSLLSFLLSSSNKNSSKKENFVIVEKSKEAAAYIFNDLENLHPKSHNLYFFNSSYKKEGKYDSKDKDYQLLRTEVLDKISKNKNPFILVTYIEAFSEKVIKNDTLKNNTFTIKLSEKLSVDFLRDFFQEYGFMPTDFVSTPGDYSIRGGIIDVFSFSKELPFRIELFDDEVESIRTFDPDTQLSESNLSEASVIPSSENIENDDENKCHLTEFINNSTDNNRFETNYILNNFKEQGRLLKEIISQAKEVYKASDFYNFASLKNFLENTSKIEYGKDCEFDYKKTIVLKTSLQPNFNKNFKLLSEHLKNNIKKGFKNFIFAENENQLKRIKSIIEDTEGNLIMGEKTKLFEAVNIAISEGFEDEDLKIAIFTDHQIFGRYHRFNLRNNYFKKKEAITLKELQNLKPGDYVTHIDHGIGRFAGLEKIDANGKEQEAIKLIYKDNDVLYVGIHSLHRISKHSNSEASVPKINKLGTNAWANLKNKAKTNVKKIAYDLIKLYAERKAKQGFAFTPDTYLQHELEASFIYEDTPDQEKTTKAVKKDMESQHAMDRLVCGDVGFGKTEIAIRAAFKAVTDSKQVAILVPTTILAMQHYKTFSERLKGFPCKIAYVNRFISSKKVKEIMKDLSEHKIDILIGTHRLVGKDVQFKDLGLMIIDEEQKFGVAVKDKLKTMKANIDTLTLTATPIPRTLQFSLMGARDLSVITTPPPNRFPIVTELHSFSEDLIQEAITFELERGGQVYFVHNKVKNIEDIAFMIRKLCPFAKVVVGHGQMDGGKLEDIMLSFIEGEADVLVATTIIESGLDISNANTIIINEAQNFGLSDLHQMRGRVGRSNKKAFCYLLSPPLSAMSSDARKRLQAIEQFSELGSGFNIAMRDLDIRGAGDILGAEQSGFINELGFEQYQKILNEAIQELKEEGFAHLNEENAANSFTGKKSGEFINECIIDTDLEILIPDSYINNITERLKLYKELDSIDNLYDLAEFSKNLKDRFGKIPFKTTELIRSIELRMLALSCAFEKIVIKNEIMLCYFVSNEKHHFYESDRFKEILIFIQQHPKVCKMKQKKDKLYLNFDNVKSISEAIDTLKPFAKLENKEVLIEKEL